MANLIPQSDNAVIDYTTISAVINAVNTLAKQVDELTGISSSSKTTTGATSINPKLLQSGHEKITSTDGSKITITFEKQYVTKPTVVGTVMYSGGTPLYCYMPKSISTSEVTFALNKAVPKGTAYIYWVAVGD